MVCPNAIPRTIAISGIPGLRSVPSQQQLRTKQEQHVEAISSSNLTFIATTKQNDRKRFGRLLLIIGSISKKMGANPFLFLSRHKGQDISIAEITSRYAEHVVYLRQTTG